MSNLVLESALEYIARGWAVLPLAHNSKVPAISNGLHGASKDLVIVEKMFSIKSNFLPVENIGIRTGQESGIVVLDIDVKNDGLASLHSLLVVEDYDWPDTYLVKTGNGGRHYYFKAPREPLRNRAGIWPGIDFRAENGYIVAPPSSLGPGKDYTVTSYAELAPLPDWLFEILAQAPERPVITSGDSTQIGEGMRTDYLVRLAGSLVKRGMGMQAVEMAVEAENEEKCNPPLEQWEIDNIVKSASQWEPGEITIIAAERKSLVIKASSLVDNMCTYLSDKDKVKGEPMGLGDGTLDKLLGGGKRLGELTAWHAEAKAGKNTLWHKLMHIWLNKGIPLGYASRELTPATEVIPNLLSLELQKNVWLSPVDKDKYQELVNNWPLYFAGGYGHFPFEDLKAWILELKVLGVNYFFFDHLHYMLEEPEDFKEASKLIKDMKALAKQEDIHIDVIIQPNKLMDGQGLTLNTIKGGAAMGQAIDNLFTFERLRNADEPHISQLTLKAVRSKLGKLGKVYLKYNPKTTDFIEVEEPKEQGPVYSLVQNGIDRKL